jgi:uncharacterized protein YjbI with pentapeptide repeats
VTSSKPPSAPRLDDDLDELVDPVLAGVDEWEAVVASGVVSSGPSPSLTVTASRLAGLHGPGLTVDRLRLVDSAVSRCDLSGAVLLDAQFRRVVFDDCRLSGVVMPGARWTDVRFVRCKMESADLRMVVGERVQFEDCVLRGADLTDARLVSSSLEECDLRDADVTRAGLRGVRLHRSQLDGLKGAEHLRGVVIDETQVLPLALALVTAMGITIDVDDDVDGD